MTPIHPMSYSTLQAPSKDELRQQFQNSVRDKVRAMRDEARALQQSGAPVVASTQAPQPVLDALNGQMQAERTTIEKLTQELTPGQSQARVEAINQQIDDARERLQTLQGQYDRAVGAPEAIAMTLPPQFNEEIPRQVIPLVGIIMSSLVLIAIGWPLARAWARRMDRKTVATPSGPDMSPRFDRIEQAIEAMAIEVERISEGQRFTTKLMSEMRALPSPNPLNDFKGVQPRVAEPVRSEGKP
ncbi:MAG: hypothetical protein U0132_06425 [Gemmatimonadaceae bacterium]